jgi:hypothetical protein
VPALWSLSCNKQCLLIHMPHGHFICQLLLSWELSIVNFTDLRLCSCKEFFVSQMVSLIVLLMNKGYPLKNLYKRTRGLLDKKNSFLEFQHLQYSEWFCIVL